MGRVKWAFKVTLRILDSEGTVFLSDSEPAVSYWGHARIEGGIEDLNGTLDKRQHKIPDYKLLNNTADGDER